jgi:hypothetical protein
MKMTKRSSSIGGKHGFRILVLSAVIFISVIAVAFIPRRFVSESFMDSTGDVPIDPPVEPPVSPPPTTNTTTTTTGPTYNNNVTVNSPPPPPQSSQPHINSLNGHVRTVITYDDNDYYVRRRSLYPYYDGSIPSIYAPGPPMPSSTNWWWWPYPYNSGSQSQDSSNGKIKEMEEREEVQTKTDMTTLFVGAAVGAGIAAVLIAVGAVVATTSRGKK